MPACEAGHRLKTVPSSLTLTPIPYRLKVGFSGSLSADAAGRGPLHRANSKGVIQSSALWGRLSL
jgi:hypothetical protein